MIYENSRYVNAAVERAIDARGVTRPTVYPAPLTIGNTRYRLHRAKQGDRFDLLAYTFLKDPTLWWVIADFNPEITTPDEIPAGSLIRIPS